VEFLEILHNNDGFEFCAEEAWLQCMTHTVHLATLEVGIINWIYCLVALTIFTAPRYYWRSQERQEEEGRVRGRLPRLRHSSSWPRAWWWRSGPTWWRWRRSRYFRIWSGTALNGGLFRNRKGMLSDYAWNPPLILVAPKNYPSCTVKSAASSGMAYGSHHLTSPSWECLERDGSHAHSWC